MVITGASNIKADLSQELMEKYPQFYPHDQKKVVRELGPKKLLEVMRSMLLIHNFEIRAEQAYQQGYVGGFFHSYIGQEAIQTAMVYAVGVENWYATTYRCHALALLLGATPNEIMSELYGRANGNAMGRGGSMHLYTERLLGGFGIVGGHIPVATGAAFTIKYLEKDELAICFLGDGAVAQGAFHEALNLSSLWDLPVIYVIENNLWGMGTAVERAIANRRIAEEKAPGYSMKGYTVNGMDFFNCYAAFSEIAREVKKTSKPVLIEALTQRFRGHSISDPGLYRDKEELQKVMQRDPLIFLRDILVSEGILTADQYKELDKEQKTICQAAMKHAESSPWPDPLTLEEDVFAP